MSFFWRVGEYSVRDPRANCSSICLACGFTISSAVKCLGIVWLDVFYCLGFPVEETGNDFIQRCLNYFVLCTEKRAKNQA